MCLTTADDLCITRAVYTLRLSEPPRRTSTANASVISCNPGRCVNQLSAQVPVKL